MNQAESLFWFLVDRGEAGATMSVMGIRFGMSPNRIRQLLAGARKLSREYEGAITYSDGTYRFTDKRAHINPWIDNRSTSIRTQLVNIKHAALVAGGRDNKVIASAIDTMLAALSEPETEAA